MIYPKTNDWSEKNENNTLPPPPYQEHKKRKVRKKSHTFYCCLFVLRLYIVVSSSSLTCGKMENKIINMTSIKGVETRVSCFIYFLFSLTIRFAMILKR